MQINQVELVTIISLLTTVGYFYFYRIARDWVQFSQDEHESNKGSRSSGDIEDESNNLIGLQFLPNNARVK